MRIFKTRTFARWMRQSNLTDPTLCLAVEEMSAGLTDAHLGGNLVKKRVAQPGRGKRGGARTIVATNLGSRWFFLFGFEKNDKANINKNELKFLQEVAKELLGYSDSQLETALATEEIMEVRDGNGKAEE